MKTPSKKVIKKMYLSICQLAQCAYEQDLLKVAELHKDDYVTICEKIEALDQVRMDKPIKVGLFLVKDKTFTLDEIHNMAWEGFNGLMEAHCVKTNIQNMLGLPVDPLDISKFLVIA
jgi:hypothetical protein